MKHICYFIFFGLLLSCSNNNTKENLINCEVSNYRIDPSITQALDSSSYSINHIIPLVGDRYICVDKVEFFDNKIYILDKECNRTVVVFDNNGNYLYKLGEQGRAKSEYIKAPDDFSIHRETGEVFIYEKNAQKIIVFSCEGNFNRVIRLKKNLPYCCVVLESGNLAMAADFVEGNDKFELQIIDPQQNFLSGYMSLKYDHTFRPNSNTLHNINDETFFSPSSCDTVYVLKNDSIKRAIAIDFGKYKMSANERQDMLSAKKDIDRTKGIRGIYRYYENAQSVVVLYDYNTMGVYNLLNKSTNMQYNAVNLLEGLMPSKIVSITENHIVFILTLDEILARRRFKKEVPTIWNEMASATPKQVLEIYEQPAEEDAKAYLLFVNLN